MRKTAYIAGLVLATAAIGAPPSSTDVPGLSVHWDRRKGEREREHDHSFARAAVMRREVLPMPRVLALVADYQPGDVMEVELKSRRDMLYYDVDVLAPSGEVHALLIDARTGKLLSNQPRGK